MKTVKNHIFLLTIVFSFMLGLFFKFDFPSEISAQTETRSYESREECIGEALAEYMNTVIDDVDGKLRHAKLLSPAFNLTNNHEVEIFDYMKEANAKFDKLDGFAGNTYTVSGKAAMSYYEDNGWKSKFDSYRKGTFFTEFGQFDIGTGGDISSSDLDKLRGEFQRADGDGWVQAVNFFVPLYGDHMSSDSQWDQFRMSDSDFQTLISANPSLAGANPGLPFGDAGGLGDRISGLGAQWTVQIAYSPGDDSAAAAAVNALKARGLEVIIRLCSRDSCGFQSPETLASFIRSVDSKVNGSFYITLGPNEPATENWVAPECGDVDEEEREEWEVEDVECGDVSNEFHSLRPYPGSPCYREPEELTLFCGNDLIVQEAFTLTLSEAQELFPCESAGGGRTKCTYILNSTANVGLNPDLTRLPILGNTELVPNSINKSSVLDYEQRVTNYVSWYLNGITQRAEEQYFRTPDNVYELTTLSGPIRKLFPRVIQADIRNEEEDMVGEEEAYGRHDQIYVCTGAGTPRACYQKDNLREVRLTEGSDFIGDVTFPYKPYSSTEDRVGGLTTTFGLGDFSYGEVEVTNVVFEPANDNPFGGLNTGGILASFPHTEESNELAWQLQTSYLPEEYADWDNIENIGNPPLGEADPEFTNPFSYCEVEDSRTNAGDKIYTDFLNDSEENIAGRLSYHAEAGCLFPEPERDDDCVDACEGSTNEIECIESCPYDDPECEVVIHIPLNVEVKTPLLDQIWGRLAGGTMSVFQRMFPKIGSNAPLDEIKDIPGEGRAAYTSVNTGSSIPTSGTATLAGDPTSNRLGGNAKVFFPHLGSIHDYFLKGIQLALRPKGFGEISFDAPEGSAISGNIPEVGDCPVVESGPCTIGNLAQYLGNDLTKATYASQVCYAETHGYPFATTTSCLNGGSYDYSIGLFQINLLVTGAYVNDPETGERLECSTAFSEKDWRAKTCTISDDPEKRELLQRCVELFKNPEINIQKMVEYSQNGTNWQPWLIAKNRCNLP